MAFKKYFTMSFDDGVEQDKQLIKLLNKYNIKCTFNLNGGLFGEKNLIARIGDVGFMSFSNDAVIRKKLFNTSKQYRIPQDEIKQVYEGFEVASHSFKHEPLALMSASKVNDSIARDIEVLSSITGYPIIGHAYPGGISSTTAAECLNQNNIIYGREAFSSNSYVFPENPLRFKPTCSYKDKYTLELLDQFISAKPIIDDLLFVMWGHGYEFDYGTNQSSWEYIEKILNKISSCKDITFCTNRHAFEEHKKMLEKL